MSNHHATLIAIDGKGVLIQGPSGSGKTLLALHLFKRCKLANVQTEIIADDHVFISEKKGQLVGQAPPNSKRQLEVRGFGIVDLPLVQIDHVTINLHVSLVDQSRIIRFWDDQYSEINGVRVKSLTLSTAQMEAAGNAVLAALDLSLHI